MILDNHTFYIDCYIFPLSGVIIILGVSWLATLGDVTANWANLTMEFQISGKSIRLLGDHSLTRKVCEVADLDLVFEGSQIWLL